MTQGFVMLNRELANKMKDLKPFDYKLLMTVITNCIYIEQYEHNGQILNKGEWLRSYRQLQQDLSYIENKQLIVPTIDKIRASIKRLLHQEMLTNYTKNNTKYCTTVLKLHESLVLLLFPTSETGTTTGTTPSTTPQKVVELPNKNNKVINNNKVFNNKELKTTTTKLNSVNMLDSGANFAEAFLLAYGKHPSPLQIQEFLQYIEDGLEEALIVHAITISAKVTSSVAYLWGVLRNWTKAGIKTLESAMTEKKNQSKQVTKSEADRQELYDKYSDLNW